MADAAKWHWRVKTLATSPTAANSSAGLEAVPRSRLGKHVIADVFGVFVGTACRTRPTTSEGLRRQVLSR